MEYINEYFNYLESEDSEILTLEEFSLLEKSRLSSKYREVEPMWKLGLKAGLSGLLPIVGFLFLQMYRLKTDICHNKCGGHDDRRCINKCYVDAINGVLKDINKETSNVKNTRPKNEKETKRKEKLLSKLNIEKEKWSHRRDKYKKGGDEVVYSKEK